MSYISLYHCIAMELTAIQSKQTAFTLDWHVALMIDIFK